MDSSTPRPKPPRRPPPVFKPDLTESRPPAAPPSVDDPRAPVKVKPYNGSCPGCQHGSMFPLVRFHESDVNENPTVNALEPGRAGALLFPFLSFALILITWTANLTWDKNRVARGRAKVKKARAEVLPRAPQSVICPNCYEVLERI